MNDRMSVGEKFDEIDQKLARMTETATRLAANVEVMYATNALLRSKAQALVDLMLDAEINHGGLIGTKTLRARDELRLELARWKKP